MKARIHKFEQNGTYILLDINSGAVHVIDKMIYDMMDTFDGANDDAVRAAMAGEYPQAEVDEALSELHALMDAMLGAAALGDIGMHFPDTDPAWEGADSLLLLGKTAELLRREGWQVENVDVTILAQRPKMKPQIPQMRENFARAMGVPVTSVSVKATTTERLGFVGRGEGCEVWATVLLAKTGE